MTKQREPSQRFGLVPHREIAKELGVAVGSVQTIERRAIQKFKPNWYGEELRFRTCYRALVNRSKA